MSKRRTMKAQPDPELGAVPAHQTAETEPSDASQIPEAEGGAGGALVEAPEEAARRLGAELDELRDQHLRLLAEFDNFRKRVARERTETWSRAQADVISNILDALDDLGRVTSQDAAQTKAEDLLAGVELVERKLLRELESAGLARVGSAGEPFDPNLHEAVGAVPASAAADDGKVAAVFQVGYRFGDTLLRPARVQVLVAPEAGRGGDGGPVGDPPQS